MNITVSNRLEILSARLAEDMSCPLVAPLASETIILQSSGMQKWLSLELAQHLGICANCRFPFPNKFLDEIFSAFIPEYRSGPEYDINVLTWKLMDLIPQLIAGNDFQPLRNYLGEDYAKLKLYQLASRIAVTFDQYLIFRPEMILDWEDGKINDIRENWQARLWQDIVKSQGPWHKARLRRLYLATNFVPEKGILPERISIFGISYLTPYHLNIFSRLSNHIPVNIYYLNPSPEFWADIKSGREIDLTLQKTAGAADAFDDGWLHLESGNRLLASMGSVGRDFFGQIAALSADYGELFAKPRETNLLTAIQSDIYLLYDRGKDEKPSGEITAADESVQIHSCHSPLREVETLHNTLLKLFEDDGSLLGKDILVMTPDIEKYAPYIEAVFESRVPKIPYSIADRSDLAGNSVSRGFFGLLDLVDGRFTAAEVLSLLENEAISEKFGITGTGRELIRRWVTAVNIRWGLDKEHRKEFNLPEFAQNTWQEGINSLLAGIALDARRDLFAGILPYSEIEGDKTEILGNFLDFWTALRHARKLLTGGRTLTNWCDTLKLIIADFFPAAGDSGNDLHKLRDMIDRVADEQQSAKLTAAVDLSVIKNHLSKSADSVVLSSRYLSGGVTFCAMLPMRSIPFAVICLIGMDNEAYPRKDNKAGFDLTEAKKRVGDRSLRSEDQYLFLEAILSARKNLIISYVGQSSQDNSVILPSTLVSDLLDYIDGGFAGGGEGITASARIVKYHHLHEFHPDYFRGQKMLYSYSPENYLAARALISGQKEVQPFIAGELKELPLVEKEIRINDLISFYRHPVKYFLEKRLCLKIPRDTEEPDDREPFTIDRLNAYSIKQELLEAEILNLDAGKVYEIGKAAGVLPVGVPGDYYFSSLTNQAQDFTGKVYSFIAGKKPAEIAIDLNIDGIRLTGTIASIYENNLIHYRPAALKANDYLKTWINHLLINVALSSGISPGSILLGEDAQWRFKQVDNAGRILEGLIRYYRQGQKKPLKLFPRSSWEYAGNLLQKQKSKQDALWAARLVWFGDANGWADGEAQEIACKICFAGTQPLDAEFENTALEILAPVFFHLEKLEFDNDSL